MRLLVSVRSAEEVPAALQGGADIIDAKEPDHGSLGPVHPEVLRSIAAEVPDSTELSVALGDFSSPAQTVDSISAVPLSVRSGSVYLKLGFAGMGPAEQIVELLAAARVTARKHSAQPRIIAVAYADAALAGTPDPGAVVEAARQADCHGVLFDTHVKGGANLLHWISPTVLRRLLGRARGYGLLSAVAGGLAASDLKLVARAIPDVVGFRSAACRGGRAGRVSPVLVQELRRRLNRLDSGFLQEIGTASRLASRNA